MPGRGTGKSTHIWLSSVLALRLRQIERNFPTYSAFVAKAGISHKTLGLLRNGKGNPSFKTLIALAESFEISVWSLLGIRDESAKLGAESFGFSAEDVQDVVSPGHLDEPDDSGDPGE